MTKKISFEDACILNAVRFLRFCASLTPASAAVSAGRLMGLAAFALSKRRDIARRNLRAAFSQTFEPRAIRRLARRSFQNIGAGFGEMLKIPEMDKRYLDRHMTIEGYDRFVEAMKAGKGVLLLTAHYGSWEMLNISAGILGYPLNVLVRTQKHPRSDEYLNQLRSSKGTHMIHKGLAVRELFRVLRSGGVVGMLIDQDGGKQGVFVNLFGRRSSTPSGAAALSRRTGCAVFSVFIQRTGHLDHRVLLNGPIAMDPAMEDEALERQLLQGFTDDLERAVKQAPEQWLWAHRRWKSTPDRWIVILSDGKDGHLKQSEAVVESIRRARIAAGSPSDALHVRRIELHWKSRRRLSILKAFGWLTGTTSARLLQWALEPDAANALFSSYADIVVSCGSSLVDAHLWLKRENGARSVVVMKPHRALGVFETVLAPKHDRVADRPNVFRTEGAPALSDPEQSRLRAAALARELRLNPAEMPVISLYLGGDAGKFRYDREQLRLFLNDARAVAEGLRADLLVTTSRRTPAWAEEMARHLLERSPALRLLVQANIQNRPGIIEAMAGISSAHWVSGESVSMVSEAAAGGAPVWTFFPGDRSQIKKKYRRFLEGLAADGRVQPWSGDAEHMKSEVGRRLGSPRAVSSQAGSNIPAEAIQRVLA